MTDFISTNSLVKLQIKIKPLWNWEFYGRNLNTMKSLIFHWSERIQRIWGSYGIYIKQILLNEKVRKIVLAVALVWTVQYRSLNTATTTYLHIKVNLWYSFILSHEQSRPAFSRAIKLAISLVCFGNLLIDRLKISVFLLGLYCRQEKIKRFSSDILVQ